MRLRVLTSVLALASLGAVARAEAPDVPALEAQVRAAETAFAKTMADRDLAGFRSFVAEDAIFLGATALRGRDAVVERWQRFYEGAKAPFSWEPETVVVLASGTLALSSGPVFDPDAQRVGTFNSTWRREADGSWKVVLDKGCPPCDCGTEK